MAVEGRRSPRPNRGIRSESNPGRIRKLDIYVFENTHHVVVAAGEIDDFSFTFVL